MNKDIQTNRDESKKHCGDEDLPSVHIQKGDGIENKHKKKGKDRQKQAYGDVRESKRIKYPFH
jgi:hypothetical protein